MAARIAWVLNLDADLELAAGARYSPTRGVVQAMQVHAARLVGTLVSPDALVVDDASPPGIARGLVGRAFCPTPRALALLVRAGAAPEAHPSAAVLRAVNSRAFAASLGATLPGAAFETELAAAVAHLAAVPPVGDAWRLKRAFGMAGRGQRIAAMPASEADIAFVKAGVAAGGVQVEPNVTILEEYASHGRLAPDGTAVHGAVVRQVCDARGAWLRSEPLPQGDVPPAAIAEEAQRVARALANAGYFGPFGVDAYTYRDAHGRPALQPRSEINARYSMGFAVGFGVG